MLLHPLTKFQNFIVFLYTCFIVLIQMLSAHPFSFAIEILLIVFGTLFLIALFQDHKIVNLLCAVFNFCISVGVNYVLLTWFAHFSVDENFFKSYPHTFCLYLVIQIIFCYFISCPLYKIIYQYYYNNY